MPNTREKLIELLGKTPGIGWSDSARRMVADHLIAHGVTAQEWISVKERLPEESGDYLVYCGEYDGICVLHYEVLKTKGKWGSKWKEVTHWMPLPEPPKGE